MCSLRVEQEIVLKPFVHCIGVILDVLWYIVFDNALIINLVAEEAQFEYIGQIEDGDRDISQRGTPFSWLSSPIQYGMDVTYDSYAISNIFSWSSWQMASVISNTKLLCNERYFRLDDRARSIGNCSINRVDENDKYSSILHCTTPYSVEDI